MHTCAQMHHQVRREPRVMEQGGTIGPGGHILEGGTEAVHQVE